MPDLDGLLRGILEHPADDCRRLVYADALEEKGDGRGAAFIRRGLRWFGVTYGGNSLELPAELRVGLPPLPEEFACEWRHGFIMEVRCPSQVWLDHGRAVCARHPVEWVIIRDKRPYQATRPEYLPRPSLRWIWWSEGYGHDGQEDTLPRWLIERYMIGRESGPSESVRAVFDSEQRATGVMNAAYLNWARDANGLPPLPLPAR